MPDTLGTVSSDSRETVPDTRDELLAELRGRLDERDRRLAHLEAEVTWLRGELERRRWPGLRRWWRRVWEGEG